MNIYVVKSGDTVYGLASEYGVGVDDIAIINQLQYPYTLVVGQSLLIPENGETDTAGRREIFVNGFAYPFISRWVLNATLKRYMTFLSVFSYGFTPEGKLIYPLPEDDFMLEAAAAADTAPVLVLTPLDENGRFNNNLIHSLINSREATDRLTEELLYVLQEKGFYAVDIDFEYIYAEDRDAFTTFVAELTVRLNAENYQVYVDLAPKTSSDQPGLLYEGKDYGGLGAAANAVLLMTYEWGYAYGPPMAVAPINQVRRVVEYALSQIPADKVSLGIPNYGYDWTLPYVDGGPRAVTIGNVEAVGIARDNSAVILFDETAQTPYFYYSINDMRHVVWFEDARSMNAKLSLVNEYSLRGVGYWTIMQWFEVGLQLAADKFTIKKYMPDSLT